MRRTRAAVCGAVTRAHLACRDCSRDESPRAAVQDRHGATPVAASVDSGEEACTIEGPMTEPLDVEEASARRVGTTLKGKWVLEQLIGVGGMASVYAGRHKIGRLEAIKILHAGV